MEKKHCYVCNSTSHICNKCPIYKEAETIVDYTNVRPIFGLLKKELLKAIVYRYNVSYMSHCDVVWRQKLKKTTKYCLTQICYQIWHRRQKEKKAKKEKKQTKKECPICYEPITSTTGSSQSKCGHTFCSSCFIKTVRMNVHCPICPMCRENLL